MMFIWKYGFRRIGDYFSKNRAARMITAGLFLLLIFGLAAGVYEFFVWQFSLLSGSSYFALTVSLFVWELLFLTIFGLAYASAFVGGIFAVFRTGADDWIMASPKYHLIVWRAWLRLFESSLWPFIVIGLPAVLSARTAFGMSYPAIIPPLVAMVFLIALAVTAAMLTFMLPAAVLYWLSKKTKRQMLRMSFVVAIGVLCIVLGACGAWLELHSQSFENMFSVLNLSARTADPSVIVNEFKFFPSHPVAMSIFLSETEGWLQGSAPLLGMAITTAIALIVLLITTELYLPLWQILQEGHNNASAKSAMAENGMGKTRTRPKPAIFPRFFKSPGGAIFEKELLLTFREMRNFLWFGFLLAMWLVQASLEFLLRFSSIYHSGDFSQILIRLQTLELATTVYFMCAFVLRFAFPAFSVERKTAWLLGTAPLDLGKIFTSKEAFYVSLFTALALLFSLANFAILGLPVKAGAAFLAFILIATASIATWGLSLGALFPNFDTDDPELLSTSLPGLAFIGSALAYGALGIFLFYRFLNGSGFLAVGLFEIASLIAAGLLVGYSRQHVRKMEFVKEVR